MKFAHVIILLFTANVFAQLKLKKNPQWSELMKKQISSMIKSNFKRAFCVHVIHDDYMHDLLMETREELPLYNIRHRKIPCSNILIAFKNSRDIKTILNNDIMLQEAKYVLLTTSNNSANYLREIVEERFYIDVSLIQINNDTMKYPIQLGYVIGNNGRVDLRGRSFLVVGVRNPPFAVYQPEKKIKLNGVEIRVIRELGFTMNFRWKIREPLDKQGIGHRNNSGHWSGLKGELSTGQADLGIALLYLNLDNYVSFQLTSPYTFVCLTFLVPAPKKILGHWNALLKPLKLESWITFFIISAIYIVIFYLITKKSLVFCILETIRGAALVSGPDRYGPVSHRIIFITWLLGSFFVAGLYSSELSAWMVAQLTQTPLRTVNDLAQSNIKWSQIDTYMLDILDKSYSSVANDLIHKFQAESTKAAIENQVLKGKFAVVVNVLSDGYPSGAEFLSPNARKTLVALPDCVVSHYASIGMRRGLPLIKASNLEIRRLQEAGLFQEWQARDVKTYGDGADYKNLKSKNDEVLPLNLGNLGGAVAFWILGHLFAGLVFIIEIVASKFEIVYKPTQLTIPRTPVIVRKY